jgi:hypothetical protein
VVGESSGEAPKCPGEHRPFRSFGSGTVRTSAGSKALESRGILTSWSSEQKDEMSETARGHRRRKAYGSAEGKSSAGNPRGGTGPRGREARREETVRRVRNPEGGTCRGWNPGESVSPSLSRRRGVKPHEGCRSRAGLRRGWVGKPWRGAQDHGSSRCCGAGRRPPERPRGRRNGVAGAVNRIAATGVAIAPEVRATS